MELRPLGQSGIQASVVGLGAWAIGGWPWGGTDETDSIEAIHAALDEGITLIDTAPAYGLGLSEELVGKALAGRRHQAIIATKCGLVWDTDKGTYFFDEMDKKVHRYLGPESIRREIDQSLRRLKTDCIDLYQTHWPDPTTPVAETMGCLMDLKVAGKIRAIGVSNATVEQIQEYQRVGPVDSDQDKYNLLDRAIEADLLPYCRRNHIAVLAYSPLAKGLLTGKMGPDRALRESDFRQYDPQFSMENRRAVAEMLDRYRPVADDLHLTFGQVAIAWTIAQPGVTHTLVGARNPKQARENARAGDVILTGGDLEAINAALAWYEAVAT